VSKNVKEISIPASHLSPDIKLWLPRGIMLWRPLF